LFHHQHVRSNHRFTEPGQTFSRICFLTVARKVSSEIPLCLRKGDTRKNASEGRNYPACGVGDLHDPSLSFAMSKPGQDVNADIIIANELAVLGRDSLPGFLRSFAGFPDQTTAFVQTFQWIGCG
jgi:hypothetical protein